MKKPLLLLVDDDRAVLQALEAELRPAFEEICRIETFEDPADVLAAVPRWAEEGRAIAVAVVDQVMPGMSGVELVGRLGADSPAASMRAIVLTGYADLEHAMAAANEPGAFRMLVKPWNQVELRIALAEGLAMWATDSMEDRHFVYREVRSIEEMEAALKLRYDVYCKSPLAPLLPENTGGLDASPFDLVSRHFGLFTGVPAVQGVVCSLRVAGREPSPALPWLQRLAKGNIGLAEALGKPRTSPLPMLTYTSEADVVQALVERLFAVGEPVVEPGRFALDPGHRTAVRGYSRHLAKVVIEGAVAFFFFLRIQNAVIACVETHGPLYRPFGFRDIEGTTPTLTPLLGTQDVHLHGRIEWVPSPARERCESQAKRIAWAGGVCRCAGWPDCLPRAYETGDFSATDVFCPIKAGEALTAARS